MAYKKGAWLTRASKCGIISCVYFLVCSNVDPVKQANILPTKFMIEGGTYKALGREQDAVEVS